LDADGKLILNLTRATVVCDRLEIADRPLQRMRGLLGRQWLPAGEGLLLHPAPSIHTAFMHFRIDAVFLNRELQVLKVVEQLRPWRTASARRARAVLELAAGEVTERGIRVGDHLGVVQLGDKQVELISGEANGNGTHADRSRKVSLDGSVTVWAEGAQRRAPTHDDAIRVLVVGSDRRFRAVAAALLTRRGYTVAVGERSSAAAELAKRELADVVVLDAGSSLTAAAREAAQIETLDPPVGVVVVGEETENGLSTMPVLEKWGSFDGLYGAIEHARPTRSRRLSHGGD
jgi:uncharacterized membrane protein (UPF0127 family)/CheY-like chemotaxis protein